MINSLDALLSERGLLQTFSLSHLRDTRLGIDLDIYLQSVLTNPASYEPYVAALGGAPLALITHVENDLRYLERSRIKPVFVLSGLPPSTRKTQRPSFIDDAHKATLRAQAWDAYDEGDVGKMQELLTSSRSTDFTEVVRSVLRAFRHRNVEFIVAPYLAGGQLVSLERHPKGYIHSYYGSTSLFLFPRVEKVILSLNFAAGTFTFANKNAVMMDLGIRTEEEFLDVALLAGWDHGPTFPPLIDGTLAPPPASRPTERDHLPVNLRQVSEMVRSNRAGGLGVVQSFSEHAGVRSTQFLESFCKSKAMIKCSLILRAEDGAVVALPMSNGAIQGAQTQAPTVNGAAGGAAPAAGGAGVNGTGPAAGAAGASAAASSDIPSDLHEVFSHRLPDEVFLHLARGLISHHVYTWLTTGYLAHPAPLDNGETMEYRRFVRDSLTELPSSPNCIALALACSALNPFWTSRKVNAVYWWMPTTERPVPHDSKETQQLVSRLNQWNVPVGFVDDELRNQNSSTIDIALCLGATRTDELGRRTKTPKRPGQGHLLEKKDEIVANVIWRMLELRGFLNHDHLHTPYARALHLALRASRLNDKLQEPLYLALELIRSGVLHANYFHAPAPAGSPAQAMGDVQVFSGGPSYDETEDEKRYLLLAMRCLSLIPMQYSPDAWTAPVSRELLVFSSFVKAMGRSMRHLVETIASTMLLRSDARRGRDDYLDIALSLPFQGDANTGLGVVIKCYVEAFVAFNGRPPTEEECQSSEEVKESKESVLGMLEDTFGNVKNVRGELQRGFRFWDSLMVAIKQLEEKQAVPKEVVRDFEGASKWFRPLRI